MTTRTLYRAIVLALALLAIPASATAGDWDWTGTLYGWGMDVNLDAKINDQEVIDGEIEFSNLLDDTDFAFMAHFEGKGNKAGIFADLIVTDLGDEPRIFERPNRTIQAKSDPKLTILELGGVWFPGGGGTGFGIHYGARMIDFDHELDIEAVGPIPVDRRVVDVSETLVDGLIGLRYTSLSDSGWSFAIWGDIASGGTERTWSAAAVIGYHFGSRDQLGIRFGYKHLEIDLEEQQDRLAEVETELALSGPVVGFTFGF